MIEIGKVNKIKVLRETDFGYFLDGGTKTTNDDILLPLGSVVGKIKVEDEVDVFIYKDSKLRRTATMKKAIAEVGDIEYLEVVSTCDFGYFVSIGIERDVLVPKKENTFDLVVGNKYLFYVYIDKTGRLCASTKLRDHLQEESEYEVGAEVKGIIYGFQTNSAIEVAIDKKYKGVILRNEYFRKMNFGEELDLRVIKIYEDGRLGLTPRKDRLGERSEIQNRIMDFLKKSGGVMKYNDKSDSEEIKRQFNTSKNYFKIALGGLMKQGVIEQDEFGTRIKEDN